MCSIGKGEIRYDDNATYPEVDPSTIGDGEYYSICYDTFVEDSCYDLECYASQIREYANFDPGIYIAGVNDCRKWNLQANAYAKKKCRMRSPTWSSFFKCTDEYINEGIIISDENGNLPTMQA